MKNIFTLFILLSFIFEKGFAQGDILPIERPQYLSIQTGFLVNGFNSVGFRTFFEYQKDFKNNNFQYGISYEHSRHFSFFSTGLYKYKTNSSLLSLNGYYKLYLLKNRLFWTAGLGVGAVHVYWDDKDKLAPIVNTSITLNFRISKRVYIETYSLVIILPTNRIYFSPMKINEEGMYFSLTTLPIGIKIKL